METRMTAAESLAEELQMENDGKHCNLTCELFQYVSDFRSHFLSLSAQATELAVAQEMLSTLQQRVTISGYRVGELEKEQEGKG